MNRRFQLFILVTILPWVGLSYPVAPDSALTPGQLCSADDEDFLEYRYEEGIPYCRRNVPSRLKARIYEKYGITAKERKDYTIDHLIPLSLGGANSARNLWPEHKAVKAKRPKLEHEIYVALRDGEISQDEAVSRILDAKFNPWRQKVTGASTPVPALPPWPH